METSQCEGAPEIQDARGSQEVGLPEDPLVFRLVFNCYVSLCGSCLFLFPDYLHPTVLDPAPYLTLQRKAIFFAKRKEIMCIVWEGGGLQIINLQRRRAGEWRAYFGAFLFLLSDRRERGCRDPNPSVRINRYVVFLTEARNV